MQVTRSDRHLPPIQRGPAIAVTLDGHRVEAHLGETVAAVLLANGLRIFSRDADGRPHGLFCGIGLCYECAVMVDGIANIRACVTPVVNGMVIETGAAK